MASAETSDYEQHLYPTRAQPDLHPDNLYCAGVLRGFQPLPVSRARMLELGCGNGMNLIPIAMDFPDGEFVGVDYASAPIAQAQAAAGEISVPNVRFYQADVRELAEDFGEFDYIVAHGLYSWVPDSVREALWKLASGSLSPRGLLFVSFNVLPGWHQRQILRDFCALHMERFDGEEARLRGAWAALELLTSFRNLAHPLATEAAWTIEKGFEVAIHDELFGGTEPFYLRDVVQRAAGHGLQYVGDAKERFRGGLHLAPEVEELISKFSGDDRLRREQYVDFFAMRSFRRALFAREDHPCIPARPAECLKQFWITTDHTANPPDETGKRHVHASQAELRFDTDDPMVLALFDHLSTQTPSNVSLGEWVEATLAEHPEWRGEALQQLDTFLDEIAFAGVFSLYPRSISVPPTPSARPFVRRLNRWEATKNAGITTRFHKVIVPPEGLGAAVVHLLNGERTLNDVAELLASAILQQKTSGAALATLPDASFPLLQAREFESRPELLRSKTELRNFLRWAMPHLWERLRATAVLLS